MSFVHLGSTVVRAATAAAATAAAATIPAAAAAVARGERGGGFQRVAQRGGAYRRFCDENCLCHIAIVC